MNRILLILSLIMLGYISSEAQRDPRYNWGLGVDFFGPSMSYTTVCVDGWIEWKKNFWINAEVGFGDRNHRYNAGPLYGNDAWRFYLSSQLMYDAVRRHYFTFFVGTGPYWMEAGDDLSRGFIYNMPEGALTVHDGADFRVTRLGLQCTTGVRFIVSRVTMGIRVHIPVYYAHTMFENIEDPLLVVDYEPTRIRNYQEKISGIRASSGLSFHLGVALGKGKAPRRG
jgi:hypothetical protein